jgi:hypothetical protein
LIFNTALALVATVLLWAMVSRLTGPESADRAVAIFCFFPGAFIFSMAYSEALMLALSIGCILALLRRKWLLAGILGGIATATRANALVLVLCCAWEAVMFIRMAPDRKRALPALVAPLLCPAGAVAFVLFLWRRTGTPLVWLKVERKGWGERIDLLSPLHELSHFFHHPIRDFNFTIDALGIFAILITAVLLLRTRPPVVLVLYSAGIVALATFDASLGARPRFILTAFPLVAAIGQRLKWNSLGGILGVSAAAMAGLTILTVTTLYMTP